MLVEKHENLVRPQQPDKASHSGKYFYQLRHLHFPSQIHQWKQSLIAQRKMHPKLSHYLDFFQQEA